MPETIIEPSPTDIQGAINNSYRVEGREAAQQFINAAASMGLRAENSEVEGELYTIKVTGTPDEINAFEKAMAETGELSIMDAIATGSRAITSFTTGVVDTVVNSAVIPTTLEVGRAAGAVAVVGLKAAAFAALGTASVLCDTGRLAVSTLKTDKGINSSLKNIKNTLSEACTGLANMGSGNKIKFKKLTA